jgi:hypothetical protein
VQSVFCGELSEVFRARTRESARQFPQAIALLRRKAPSHREQPDLLSVLPRPRGRVRTPRNWRVAICGRTIVHGREPHRSPRGRFCFRKGDVAPLSAAIRRMLQVEFDDCTNRLGGNTVETTHRGPSLALLGPVDGMFRLGGGSGALRAVFPDRERWPLPFCLRHPARLPVPARSAGVLQRPASCGER